MSLVRPFWFAQRQGKAEEAGPNLYKLTGPNLREALIGVRQAANARWIAFVRAAPDGPDLGATAPEIPTEYEAWAAAFELFRNRFVI